MVDVTNVGNRAEEIEISDKSEPISGIVVWKNDDIYFVAGDDTGYVIEIDCPFVSSDSEAAIILNQIKGFVYRPYSCSGTMLDPASELGDAVLFASFQGGIYSRETTFDGLMSADISAPFETELQHEYQYESSAERRYSRESDDRITQLRTAIQLNADNITLEVTQRTSSDNELSSRITQTANSLTSEITERTNADNDLSSLISQTSREIRAEVSGKVDQDSGSGTYSTFGWRLYNNYFALYADNDMVFYCDKYGVSITGQIVAESGKIGEWLIADNDSIYNGIPYRGNKNSDSTGMGTYGTNWAFWAGDGAFSVRQSGAVECYSINVYGNQQASYANSRVFGNTGSGLNNALSAGQSAYDTIHGVGSISANYIEIVEGYAEIFKAAFMRVEQMQINGFDPSSQSYKTVTLGLGKVNGVNVITYS